MRQVVRSFNSLFFVIKVLHDQVGRVFPIAMMSLHLSKRSIVEMTGNFTFVENQERQTRQLHESMVHGV